MSNDVQSLVRKKIEHSTREVNKGQSKVVDYDYVDYWLLRYYINLTAELPMIRALQYENALRSKVINVSHIASSLLHAIDSRDFIRPPVTASIVKDLEQWVNSCGELRSARLVKFAILISTLNTSK